MNARTTRSFPFQLLAHLTVYLFVILCSPFHAYAQTVTAVKNVDNPVWSDPDSWDTGAVPTITDEVLIPADIFILLDQDVVVQNITVRGTLQASNDTDINLSTDYLLVDGSDAHLIWGTSSDPYLERAVITLTGNDTTHNVLDMGTKFIGATNGGTIQIHGETRVSWTQLVATADRGVSEIKLVSPTDWRPGDEIVIASTDFSAHQAETRTITAVGGSGKTVWLDVPLDTMHYGEVQYYKSGSLELDERAEVGLLSRNILIQGEAPGSIGFGGHLIIRGHSSKGFIAGVELFHMGQKGRIGKYPHHWHHAMNAAGQYIKNSSIHRSFNRAVTVHHTNNALIEDVVAYDHIGHGFFLEAGSERGNIFNHNLGMLTRLPVDGEQVQYHDRLFGEDDYQVMLPATFWITNPDNIYVQNAAAGSEGSGFWITSQPHVIDDPGSALQPGQLPIQLFSENRAHSNNFANLGIDGKSVWFDPDGDGEVDVREEFFDFEEYRPLLPAGHKIILDKFTSFKCRERGIWTRSGTLYFDDCRLADTHVNSFFSFNNILQNSLIVGQSANWGTKQVHQVDHTVPYSLPIPQLWHDDHRNKLDGHILYDGPSGLDNVHFAEMDGIRSHAFGVFGADRKSPVHWSRNISFEMGTPFNAVANLDFGSHLDHVFASGLVDFDGTVTGSPFTRLVPKNQYPSDLTDDPRAIRDIGFNVELEVVDFMMPPWEAAITHDMDIATMFVEPDWGTVGPSAVFVVRYKGLPTDFDRPNYPTVIHDPGGNRHMQPSVYTNEDMLNRKEMYLWQFQQLPFTTTLYMQWARLDQQVISVVTNVPHDIELKYEDGTAVALASDFWDFTTSTTEKYFVWDNVLYIHHKASEDYDKVDINGLGNHYRSKPMIMCYPTKCGTAGVSEGMVIADFEQANYDRSTLSGDGLPTPMIYASAEDPTFCTGGACDDYIEFEIETDGDGVDDYIKYYMNFYDQPWTYLNEINLKVDAPAVTIVLHDRSAGAISLGNFTPVGGNIDADFDHLAKDMRDEIHAIEFRVYESSVSDLFTAGVSKAVRLYEVGISNKSLPVARESREVLSDEPTRKQLFKLYPNPTQKTFTLSTQLERAGDVRISIFSLQAQLVYTDKQFENAGNWSRSFKIADLGLTNGIYQVVVEGDEIRESRLLVVK